MKISALERLSRHFERGDGCWLWTAARDPFGYGVAYYDGRPQRAHRAVYTEIVGPIPDGLVLDHLCRVPGCVRPSHLEPVTQKENLARGADPNAAKKAKTHCVNGHPFEGHNLIRRKAGGRDCRACTNAAQQRSRARRKVA